MNFKTGHIQGVTFRPLSKHVDHRGWLTEMWRSDEPPLNVIPVMAYASFTKPGVKRGPHEHEHQTDWFVFFGPSDFLFMMWDNRKDSETYLNRMTMNVGECCPSIIVVPNGVVHGYQNIGEHDGLVINMPDKLFAGYNRKERIDEIRHEDDIHSPFKLGDAG